VTRILGEDSKNKREVRLLYKLVQTHLIMPTSFNYHQVYRYIFFVADLFSFMSCFVFVGSDREPVACVFSICNSTIGQCLSRLDRNKLIKQATWDTLLATSGVTKRYVLVFTIIHKENIEINLMFASHNNYGNKLFALYRQLNISVFLIKYCQIFCKMEKHASLHFIPTYFREISLWGHAYFIQ
jgi:hypothetical protein